jgi:hypothetical protein
VTSAKGWGGNGASAASLHGTRIKTRARRVGPAWSGTSRWRQRCARQSVRLEAGPGVAARARCRQSREGGGVRCMELHVGRPGGNETAILGWLAGPGLMNSANSDLIKCFKIWLELIQFKGGPPVP